MKATGDIAGFRHKCRKPSITCISSVPVCATQAQHAFFFATVQKQAETPSTKNANWPSSPSPSVNISDARNANPFAKNGNSRKSAKLSLKPKTAKLWNTRRWSNGSSPGANRMKENRQPSSRSRRSTRSSFATVQKASGDIAGLHHNCRKPSITCISSVPSCAAQAQHRYLDAAVLLPMHRQPSYHKRQPRLLISLPEHPLNLLKIPLSQPRNRRPRPAQTNP